MPKTDTTIFDVVVVGGGIAGLSSAYHLAREGMSVAVLDRENFLTNASFNSTAITSHDPDADWDAVIARFGIEGARDIWKLSEFAFKHLAEYAQRANPHFIAKRLPAYIFSSSVESDERLLREYELYKKIGARCSYLKEGSSIHKNFRNVLVLEDEGQSNNQAILKSLLKMVRRYGGKLFPHHFVASISRHGTGADVIMSDGRVIKGRSVIVSTGEGMLLPELQEVTSRKKTFVLSFEKKGIPRPFKNSVLWDVEEPYHYIRAFRGRTLWVGGSDVYDSEFDAKKDYYAPLEKFARDFLLFDETYKRGVTWDGTFYPTDMGLPFIGEVKDSPLSVVTGFGGTGILMSFISGYLLSSWLRGKETHYKKYFALDRSHDTRGV